MKPNSSGLKSGNFWFCLSLVANVALLAGLLALARQPSPVSGITTPVSGVNGTDRPVEVALLPEAPIETPPTNLLACVARLRNAGAPNRILARMVLEDFDEHWQHRLEEMQAGYARGELDANPVDALNANRAEEQEEALRAALGEDGFKEWDLAQTLRSLNLNSITLTADETNGIYSLHKDLQSQLRALDAARLRGDIDQEEYGKACNAAQLNNDEKIKQLLGSERLAVVRSPAREPDIAFEHALHKLNASDDQIASLLKLQLSYTVQRADIEKQMQDNPGNPSVASLNNQLNALDAARDQQRQSILGIDAFAALQKEQDYRYQTMKRRADAWSLNAGQIDFVYKDIQAYEKSAADYQLAAQAMESRGEIVDWNAVNQNLLQFSQKNEQNLQGYLGVEQFNKLTKNHLLPFDQP